MKSSEIRENFLKFFETRGHERVPSSSLIPAADPTLLFTNAGMVQFKDYFLGNQQPKSPRATSSQKCVRAGGKHNDLENVGFTARHHTFFEMLGNFSFGDYFKKEAIELAWTFLTQELGLSEERLWVTVYETDDEAWDLWKAIGMSESRMRRLGEKDNFWAMGDTGPCGPCTEIHYDWGEKVGSGLPNAHPGNDDVRFLEIWNLVFMQFNRDAGGKLTDLPQPSVDTGAGLERLACVLQGEFNNYDTDLFQPLISEIAKKTQVPYHQSDETDVSLRVIADHLRSCAFLMADGVTPSNEGRGYVLRRILRRAIRHGKKLGQDAPFLFELVGKVSETLGLQYPELLSQKKLIAQLFEEEEIRFHATLHHGLGVLEQALENLEAQGNKVLGGEIAFKLYDTFGFPLDLTEVIVQEKNFTVDTANFDACMEKQRKQSQWSTDNDSQLKEKIRIQLSGSRPDTKFLGYEKLRSTSKLLYILDKDALPQEKLGLGERGFLVFNSTPFYAEGGGQVGDRGVIMLGGSRIAEVEKTFKVVSAFVHQIKVIHQEVERKQSYDLCVDSEHRLRVAINHTCTHLLHAALRRQLGERVGQAGSLVDSGHLRFDFTYPKKLTEKEIQSIEKEVNQAIERAEEVHVEEMAFSVAAEKGALAFFDEKYGEDVRVVRVGEENGPTSMELCGGTHLQNTSQAGLFKIVSESSVASGTRRIEAITSKKAIELLQKRNESLVKVEKLLDTQSEQVVPKIAQLLGEIKTLRQLNEKMELKLAAGQGQSTSAGGNLWENKERLAKDLDAVIAQVEISNPKVLRSLVDQVRDHLPSQTLVALAAQVGDKAMICVGLTRDLESRLNAGSLVAMMAEHIGGKGGGRKDFAQAGGNAPQHIPQALAALKTHLQEL